MLNSLGGLCCKAGFAVLACLSHPAWSVPRGSQSCPDLAGAWCIRACFIPEKLPLVLCSPTVPGFGLLVTPAQLSPELSALALVVFFPFSYILCDCGSHGSSMKPGLLLLSVQVVGGLREAGGPQLPRGGVVLRLSLSSSMAPVLRIASLCPQCPLYLCLEALISVWGPPLPAQVLASMA